MREASYNISCPSRLLGFTVTFSASYSIMPILKATKLLNFILDIEQHVDGSITNRCIAYKFASSRQLFSMQGAKCMSHTPTILIDMLRILLDLLDPCFYFGSLECLQLNSRLNVELSMLCRTVCLDKYSSSGIPMNSTIPLHISVSFDGRTGHKELHIGNPKQCLHLQIYSDSILLEKN